MRTLISNARLVDHEKDINMDLIIENGLIVEIVEPGALSSSDCDEVFDAKGLVVMPAFCDLHAHFRDPGFTYKEDIFTGCRAAVRGGYTTVNLMANTNPICSSMDIVNYVKAKAEELGIVDIIQTVSITKDFDWETLSHLDDISDVPFISDDGRGTPIDNVVTLNAMKKAKVLGLVILSHAEDYGVSDTQDRIAENLMTARDVMLASYTGCRLHMCHVSTKEAIDTISFAKKQHDNISCEVTPHHIALTDETTYKVAPPLRKERDRRALISAIKDGSVDMIATDHAPHTPEDKKNGSPGMTGIEIAFSICNTYLVEKGEISLSMLSKLMSYNPAMMMGINKGELVCGREADLVVIDPSQKLLLKVENMTSKCQNTPFLGSTLTGDVIATFKAGKLVYGQLKS